MSYQISYSPNCFHFLISCVAYFYMRVSQCKLLFLKKQQVSAEAIQCFVFMN